MARYGQIRAVVCWMDGVLWSSITHSETGITVFPECIFTVNTVFTGLGQDQQPVNQSQLGNFTKTCKENNMASTLRCFNLF
jgi:hypothetical protein